MQFSESSLVFANNSTKQCSGDLVVDGLSHLMSDTLRGRGSMNNGWPVPRPPAHFASENGGTLAVSALFEILSKVRAWSNSPQSAWTSWFQTKSGTRVRGEGIRKNPLRLGEFGVLGRGRENWSGNSETLKPHP